MTYAPNDLLTVRKVLTERTGLEALSLGIVGNEYHYGGYHCGADRVVKYDYSVVEAMRDSAGLSDAASALDIGDFAVESSHGKVTLRSLSQAIADGMRNGDPRLLDVREIIFSPDGDTVIRVDRLGIRNDGDDSHLGHTHVSFFRDSEGRRDRDDNFLGFVISVFEGGTVAEQGGIADFSVGAVPEIDPAGVATGRTVGMHNAVGAIWSSVNKLQAGGGTMPIDYDKLAEALLNKIAARQK